MNYIEVKVVNDFGFILEAYSTNLSEKEIRILVESVPNHKLVRFVENVNTKIRLFESL